jgi:ABC-type dipeptide/oligopeptide/nickel transport system permease component
MSGAVGRLVATAVLVIAANFVAVIIAIIISIFAGFAAKLSSFERFCVSP